MLSIRLISDCQFIHTVEMIRSLAIFYCIFMVGPFVVQVRSNDPTTVWICLSGMLLVQLFLFGLEIVQIFNLTWKVYSSDLYNFVEQAQSLIALTYIIVRAVQNDKYILPILDNELEHADSARVKYWVVANTLFFML